MTQFLPPNLLALFTARPPIPFKPPVDGLKKRKNAQPYSGISDFLSKFEVDPPPPATRGETREEKDVRRKKEKAAAVAEALEDKVTTWTPHTDPNAVGDPFKTLFVGRINFDTNEYKLKRELEQYGPIRRIHMVYNARTRKPRGYAFVEYEHERDMHSAYKHADGKKIDGRRILVDVERGRTVKSWRPRRLGGGLGGTRRGGPEDNIRHSGRVEQWEKERDRDREKDRERRRSRSPRDRSNRDRERDRDRERRRDRDRDRDRERDGERRRGRDRDRERPRREEGEEGRGEEEENGDMRSRDTSIVRDAKDEGDENGANDGGEAPMEQGEADEERPRDRERDRDRDRDRDRRDRDRDRDRRDRDRRDRDRDRDRDRRDRDRDRDRDRKEERMEEREESRDGAPRLEEGEMKPEESYADYNGSAPREEQDGEYA